MNASDWPREVGNHRVTMEWDCERCGRSFDCLSQFRQTDCQ
ncbi:hypothetical protein [Halosegnis sp.]